MRIPQDLKAAQANTLEKANAARSAMPSLLQAEFDNIVDGTVSNRDLSNVRHFLLKAFDGGSNESFKVCSELRDAIKDQMQLQGRVTTLKEGVKDAVGHAARWL